MRENELGLRLKQLRESKAKERGRRKIPQQEVAKQLNITTGTYGGWESGRTRPDVAILPHIATYFGVSIDELLGYTPVEQAPSKTNTSQTGVSWSLRRWPKEDYEKTGIEVWKRLIEGESFEQIGTALKICFPEEIKCLLADIIYTEVIEIESLPEDVDLARQVQQKFGLKEVIVISVPEKSPALYRYVLLGEASCRYFKAHVREGMKVGIAGGYPVSRMISSLRPGDISSIEAYPLATSPIVEAVALDANSLVGALELRHYWHNVRGYFLQYASPLDWKGKEGKDIKPFRPTLSALAKAKSVDIVFMGLGTIEYGNRPLNWLLNVVLSEGVSLEILRERGAVGDILYHMVDQSGQQIPSDINDIVCSIELDDLRRFVRWGTRVVAIAAEAQKKEITMAAISGKYINVLILDSGLASALLDSEEKPEVLAEK